MDAAILLLSPILLFLFLPFYSLHATSCSSLGYCIHVAKAQPFVKSHFASNLYLLQDSRNIIGKHIIMPINLTSNVSPGWDGKTPHGPPVLWRNCARTTVPFLLSEMAINHLLLSPLPPASPSPSPASFSVPIFSLSLIKQSQPIKKSHRIPSPRAHLPRLTHCLWMNTLLSNPMPTTTSHVHAVDSDTPLVP